MIRQKTGMLKPIGHPCFHIGIWMTLCLALLFLSGCAAPGFKAADKEKDFRHIVLADTEGVQAETSSEKVKRGEDAVFSLTLEEGYEFLGTDYPGSTVIRDETGQKLTLTLPGARYSERVHIRAEKSSHVIRYYANGGERLDGKDPSEAVTVTRTRIHLRPNTSIGTDLFRRSGCTLTGWNTQADGSGRSVGLGSRTDWEEGMVLYAQWEPWTKEKDFLWEKSGEFAVLTGYTGKEETVTVPGELGGIPLRRIGEGAFAGAACRRVILPAGLYEVEEGAFTGSALEELTIFDDLQKVSDYAFEECGDFRTLHINAARSPVYSGNYFGTFADKYDRLWTYRDRKKLVLFSGSSTRFGYDCQRIQKAFPEYEPVNMGVFAYSPARPQLDLILSCMKEGDILLDSPEFDAANRQFCSQRELDYAVFAMMEANYDLFAQIDVREYTQVFTAFTAYNAARADLEPRNYDVSPSYYDEDGNPVETLSYNDYGDYVLYRPNGEDDQPIYGLAVNYTVNAFPKDTYLAAMNETMGQFLQKGVKVYLTYSPRNQFALSGESTYEERQRLDAYFRENLCFPVISSLEESLYPGRYLYGTDNHLSTEGVELRTERVIRDLQEQLRREGEGE